MSTTTGITCSGDSTTLGGGMVTVSNHLVSISGIIPCTYTIPGCGMWGGITRNVPPSITCYVLWHYGYVPTTTTSTQYVVSTNTNGGVE